MAASKAGAPGPHQVRSRAQTSSGFIHLDWPGPIWTFMSCTGYHILFFNLFKLETILKGIFLSSKNNITTTENLGLHSRRDIDRPVSD